MEWSPTIQYIPGSEVVYQQLTYIALVDNISEVPENSMFWIMKWENDVEYDIGERVRYAVDGEDYQLTNTAPVGTLPTDTEYWMSYDTLMIQGDTDKVYNLDDISKSKDRLSGSALVLPTTNENLEEGSIMIETQDSKRRLPNPTVEWNDFRTRLKRK